MTVQHKRSLYEDARDLELQPVLTSSKIKKQSEKKNKLHDEYSNQGPALSQSNSNLTLQSLKIRGPKNQLRPQSSSSNSMGRRYTNLSGSGQQQQLYISNNSKLQNEYSNSKTPVIHN